MTRPANFEMFFAVRNGNRRSSVWKCWAPTGAGKNDVYITNDALGHRMKLSLHESGQWHIAFDKRFLAEHGTASEWPDRIVEQWEHPPQIAAWLTLAVRIVVAAPSVSIPVDEARDSGVSWVQAPGDERAVEIDVSLTAPNVTSPTGSWPGRNSMNTSFVTNFTLDDGTNVWIVSRFIDMPNLGARVLTRGRYFSGHSEDDLRGGNLRAVLFGSETDGSRVLYEVIGKREADEDPTLE